MKITQLKPSDDLTEAAKLFDAYRQFYGEESNLAAAYAWLSMRLSAGQSILLQAQIDHSICGLTQVYPSFCSLTLSPIWTLFDLYVHPSARGQGVADQLLATVAQLAKESGAAYVQLSTAVDNHRAQAVYRRNGWQEDHIYRVFTISLS